MEFKTSSVADVYIFSGLEVDYAAQINQMCLMGEAKEAATRSLKESYLRHKDRVRLTYEQFIEIVESYPEEFLTLDADCRSAVSAKLIELAQHQLTKERAAFGIGLFSRKVQQLLRGRGFRTPGEFGLVLANKIQTGSSEYTYKELEQSFDTIIRSPAYSTAHPINHKVNALSDAEFRKLAKVLFGISSDAQLMPGPHVPFCLALTTEKAHIFSHELLRRKDWYDRLYDIVDSASPDELRAFLRKYQELLVDKVVGRLRNDLLALVKRRKESDYRRIDRLFCLVLEYYLQGALARFKKDPQDVHGLVEVADRLRKQELRQADLLYILKTQHLVLSDQEAEELAQYIKLG